jgi:CheY-like chemotaxis protein
MPVLSRDERKRDYRPFLRSSVPAHPRPSPKLNVCPHAGLIGHAPRNKSKGHGLKLFPALPMSAVMGQKVSENPSRSPAAIGHLHARVLVVDDDEHFRVLARAILEPDGFEVIESENMQECMLQLRRQPVDALILDMVMPGRDGIEAVRELKELFPEIPIVAVSGAEHSGLYLSVSAHLGADASLEKARVSALCPLLRVILDR